MAVLQKNTKPHLICWENRLEKERVLERKTYESLVRVIRVIFRFSKNVEQLSHCMRGARPPHPREFGKSRSKG